MSKKKEITNEGIFNAAKKFTDAFFDGLKKGQEARVIKQAEKAGVEAQALRQMRKIKQEKDELERLLAKYPEAK